MTSPETPNWLRVWRILAIILGFLILIWLPFEDVNLRWVTLIAIGIVSLLVFRVVYHYDVYLSQRLYLYSLIGFTAGLLVTAFAVLLVVFKSGFHGHNVPDFTINQLDILIKRTIIWAASGLFIGSGSALWRYTKSR